MEQAEKTSLGFCLPRKRLNMTIQVDGVGLTLQKPQMFFRCKNYDRFRGLKKKRVERKSQLNQVMSFFLFCGFFVKHQDRPVGYSTLAHLISGKGIIENGSPGRGEIPV